MEWVIPAYKKSRVNWAGRILSDVDHDVSEQGDSVLEALTIINNWRASHSFPLNTFQNGLRKKAKAIDADAIIAQRIKRLSSIEQKLIRFPTMTLSQMQDIGGCRAVVKTIRQVDNISRSYRDSQFKHHLAQSDNYISNPKESGYRGVHLIYKYFSDRNSTYNGLKIEVQLRSQIQHAWATAVETVGTFLRQSLKSSEGEDDWLRFFALMGTALANREEAPPVPNTPTTHRELVLELRDFIQKLDVQNRLRAYGSAIRIVEDAVPARSGLFLMVLNPSENRVTVRSFKHMEIHQASQAYLQAEREIREISGAEAVLVSVESLAALRRAYPNYFLDTHAFIRLVNDAVRRLKPEKIGGSRHRQLQLF